MATIEQSPAGLLRQADLVRRRLRDPALRVASLPGVTLDVARMASDLGTEADALRAALTELEARTADAARAQEARNVAFAGFDAQCGPSLRFLEAGAAMAGRPDLAERCRRAGAVWKELVETGEEGVIEVAERSGLT